MALNKGITVARPPHLQRSGAGQRAVVPSAGQAGYRLIERRLTNGPRPMTPLEARLDEFLAAARRSMNG